jgi:hypothetical protein
VAVAAVVAAGVAAGFADGDADAARLTEGAGDGDAAKPDVVVMVTANRAAMAPNVAHRVARTERDAWCLMSAILAPLDRDSHPFLGRAGERPGKPG